MIFDRARPVADAVLYEGYALYPYRASSVKNRRRWMLGSLFPEGAAEALGETSRLACEVLLEAPPGAEVEALVRFLRVETRGDGQAWEEAVAEEVRVGPLRVGALEERAHGERFVREAGRALGEDGVERARGRVEGEVGVEVERLSLAGVVRLRLGLSNVTKVEGVEEARRAAMASAHVLLAVRGGGFVSVLDPPQALRAAVEGCRNHTVWPVLAGRPGERDLVLCSPIILPDHPEVAPESPGDLFDGTEMDEMLTLRILTMTDDEKREAAALDGRVRALLARSEGLGPEALARLHGAVRRFAPAGPPRSVRVAGREIGPGARVRLHPRGRSDIFDLALAGQEATVASIEQDVEDRTFVTVTVDGDPGRDLGAAGLPGHRFFFRPDEVEPLDGGGAP